MGTLQLAPGSLFTERFQIVHLAAYGGMGSVYRAIDLSDGQAVALKLLHTDSPRPDDVERFVREACTLSQLRHPNIVSYISHGHSSEGHGFLAMEWLDGCHLGQRLSQGPLSVRDSMLLCSQVADALSFAHQRGVIHRDLKPSNLFLIGGAISHVKLLDFGIARRITSTRSMTHTGLVVGTPEYMAPEQARGSRDITPAADLFSMGCVLYECLTGHPPFIADHIAAVLVRILFEEPVSMDELRPGISPSLRGLLDRLLAKNPSRRPKDASALRDELTSLGELPEPPQAVANTSTQVKPERFAHEEQSLFSIVLAESAREPHTDSATQPGSALHLGGVEQRALLQELTTLGVTPDFLANGTLVITTPLLGSAQDQAALAARAALLVRKRWPAAHVAMATGRGVIRGRTAVGEVVEQAARSLKTDTPQSGSGAAVGVWVDALSAELLRDRFVQTPQPGGALLLHEDSDADASRPLLGKPTPCVGREAELGTLESLLSGCIEESQARAILITAPPGAGKSRLRHEFLRRLEKRSESITVLLGRGELLNAGAAYGILGRALRRLCKISGSEAPHVQRQLLRQRICEHINTEEQESVFLFLGELCGVPFPEDEHPLLQAARQSPKLLPERLRQAYLTWLATECAAAPVVFVLDDLQWGDDRSVALLGEALRELRGTPLLVLALARPEVHVSFPNLWRAHQPPELALKGLSQRACERLIQQALGKQVPAESMAWMVTQCGGNALFLEELIRAEAERPMDRKAETVVAMLQARIGHLESGPRRAVLAASVFGLVMWQGGVAKLLGLQEQAPEVESWMRALVQAELLEMHDSSRMPCQKEYGFRHALVRDAAYGLLTEGDQKLGHKLAALFLETADLQVAQAILAHHYRQAGLLEQALARYLQACDRAMHMSMWEEARAYYVASDEIVRLLPSSMSLRRVHIDILLKRVHTGIFNVNFESQLGLLDEAQALLKTLQASDDIRHEDRLREARVEFYRAHAHIYGDQLARALPYFQRVLPVARDFGDQELLILSSMALVQIGLLCGQVGKALESLQPLLGPIEQLLGITVETVRGLFYPAYIFSLNGQPKETAVQLERVRKVVFQSKQNVTLKAYELIGEAFCHCFAANWLDAMKLAHEAAEFSSKAGMTSGIYCSLDLLAWAQSYNGLHAQALHSRAQAAALRKTFGRGYLEDCFEAVETEILFNAGQTEEALAKARLVSATSKDAALFFSYPIAERVWGRALGRLGAPLTEAEAHLAASLEVCIQTQQITSAILTELWWGHLLRERGHEVEAQRHFEQAFQYMEAGGYEKGLTWARRYATA